MIPAALSPSPHNDRNKAKNKSDDHPYSYNINWFTSFVKFSQFISHFINQLNDSRSIESITAQ